MDLIFPKPLEPIFHKENRKRHNLLEGGRGGAKSHTVADMLLIEGLKQPLRILCGREVQKSISESVHTLLSDKVRDRSYPYRVTQKTITNAIGTEFLFCGLKDHTVNSIKSYEGVNIFWGEEAQAFSKRSLDVLIPTIRKEGSYFVWTMNRFEEADPIYDLLIHKKRKDVLHIKINYTENPHCPQELKDEAEICKESNEDDYIHIWLGEPMAQGDRCILSRVKVKAAMERTIEAEGQIECGIDVARFGADSTMLYRRKGLKVVEEKQLYKADTVEVTNEAIVFMGDECQVTKVDDTGVGGGVSDQLISKGKPVEMINFGGSAKDKDKYPNTISEMWFEFRDMLDEIEIPNDRELLQQLTSRQYKFDNKGRRMVESKEDFKKRYGKSPDKADALLLCYYNSYSIPTITMM